MFVVTVNRDLCTGCSVCVETCPAQVLCLSEGKAESTGDECLGCQSCVSVCPKEAIKIDEY